MTLPEDRPPSPSPGALASAARWDPGIEPLVGLAVALTATTMGALAIIDGDSIRHVGRVGIEADDAPFSGSPEAIVVTTRRPVVFADTLTEPLLAGSPLVIALPPVRFYAGWPLRDDRGGVVAVLWVADTAPGTLSAHQLASADGVTMQLAARLALLRSRVQPRSPTGFGSQDNQGGEGVTQSAGDATGPGTGLGGATKPAPGPALTAAPAPAPAPAPPDRQLAVAGRRPRHQTSWYAALLDNAWDVLAILDASGCLEYANPAGERLLGHPLEHLIGESIVDLVHIDDRAIASRLLLETTTDQTEGPPVELRLRQPDGGWRTCEVAAANRLADPAVGGIVLTVRDITQHRELQHQLSQRLLHDELTGLPNRTLLLDRLRHALERSPRTGLGVTVLFADIDRFKLVNDSLGHAAGDRVLREVAAWLGELVRPSDTVARLAGDEFAVLCEDVDGPTTGIGIAHRLADGAALPIPFNGGHLTVTMSVGVAVSEPGATPESILADADLAMYRAKQRGRHGFSVYDHTLRDLAQRRLSDEAGLRHAIERGELRVVYQPMVELATGLAVGVEALVRWEHPERGLLLPADFMPLAEESGVIRDLGAWALRTAISDASRWPERTDRPKGFIAVNLSPAQLGHADIVGVMSSALADSAMDPNRVMVEVEERAAIDETGAVSGVLGSLRGLGVAIAVDRVGVGSSSLVGLHRLRPVHLKIDRSIVTSLNEPDADRAVVGALVELSRALGLRTVAVGVESEAVRDVLLGLGCDLGQGNLWLAPNDARALRAWLLAH